MFKKFLIGTLAVVAFVLTANLALASYDFSSAILKVGSRGQYVTTLQNLVGATPADGNFGPITKGKVVAWQKANGLMADGLFGPVSKVKANETDTNFGVGCTSTTGFSTTTGKSCTTISLPTDCTPTPTTIYVTPTGFIYSTFTGNSCVAGLAAPTQVIKIIGGGSSGSHSKADVSAPSAPTLASKTSTSITLTANSLNEFSIDSGSTWQSSEVFTSLTPSTSYTFNARVKETSTTNASPASVASASITTDVSGSNDTRLLSGTLGGYTLDSAGWGSGAGSIGGSNGLTVALPAGTHTLALVKGNANSVVTYVQHHDGDFPHPSVGDYTNTYTADPITQFVIDNNNDRIWLKVTSEDGLHVGYFWIAVFVSAPVIATTSTIVAGAVNPTFIVTGTNFKPGISTNDLMIGNYTNSSLAFSGVTYTSGTQITVSLAGTVGSSGNVTIQARASAFDPVGISVSNELSVSVTAAPATGDMAFALTTPAPGVNTLTGGGATRNVNISVVNNTSSVVITGTKTAGQTVLIKGYNGDINGLDSQNVTAGGTPTAPTYTVNMITPGADVHNGGTKWFNIVVSEAGKSDITYNVYILVGSPTLNPVTSANYTTAGAATTTITITLTIGTFKEGTIAASDFTFAGTDTNSIADATAIATNGTFTRTDPTHVTITDLFQHLAGSTFNTVTVLGATQATQAASVQAIAS